VNVGLSCDFELAFQSLNVGSTGCSSVDPLDLDSVHIHVYAILVNRELTFLQLFLGRVLSESHFYRAMLHRARLCHIMSSHSSVCLPVRL